MSHTVHDREIWGTCICKEYAGEWYTGLYPRYEGFFHYDMSIPLLPPIKPQVLQVHVGHITDRCNIVNNE